MRTGKDGRHQSTSGKVSEHSGKVKYHDTSHLAFCEISPSGVNYGIRLCR
jgi:hypothetical protein